MKRPLQRPVIIVLAFLISLGGVTAGGAGHEDNPDLAHITISVPETYSQCVDSVTSDTITLTGVHAPGDPSTVWSLRGFVRVEYIVNEFGARQLVPGGEYIINQMGDLNLTIFYPPISQWPVFIDPSTGLPLSEIHVDLSIEVLNEFGEFVGGIGVGPGHDWDVFCLTPPPPPPPSGDQGCTPGFWKNHPNAWESTGYSPGQTVGSVFTVPGSLGLSGDSLLTALNYGGGPKEQGAAKILLRASVAALLNASHPDIGYTDSAPSIIAQVNAALATLDRDAMLKLAADLDAQNNLGCPIDGR